MSRSVKVFLYGRYTGLLSENSSGYTFEYDDNYDGPPLSISLPVCKKKHHSKELHPFFQSLAPESCTYGS
jgi:serine/threonine-protein kinase HipA